MTDRPAEPAANVPGGTAGVAQEHDTGGTPPQAPSGVSAFAWDIGPGVRRAARVRPYPRQLDDPVHRPLRIFTLDPAQPKLDGAIGLVKVPYEPLLPGPVGRLFEVDNTDGCSGKRYARVDLEDPRTVVRDGRDPSPSDPQFHQQMVYAVASTVYAAFKGALGRDLAWGFEPRPEQAAIVAEDDPRFLLRLRLVPHGIQDKNAYYSREDGEIRFGYFQAGGDIDAKNPPGGYVFTCLSHDIIAHEVTHALLDGLRPYFLVPTRPDVLAFHEAFADLIAIFQHFAYPKIVSAALKQFGTRLDHAGLLAGLATQFGYTTASPGARRPLRSAIDTSTDGAPPPQYDPTREIHDLGSVLVSAVFEAFTTLFRRKTERYLRLATAGTGSLPAGALPADLHDVLAGEASQLASQIMRLCIRAVDYCPPVDLEFGDYLRAMITADAELIPDDPWAYREALVYAFGRRGIFPTNVRNLAEDSLRWRPPWQPIAIPSLHVANLHFAGDPGLAACADELRRQADALGQIVTDSRYFKSFGLAKPDGDKILSPCIASVRTARRVGPDGQLLFDLVGEVVQECRLGDGGLRVPFYGGATVIVGPDGAVRYAIVKNVHGPQRRDDCWRYATTEGRTFWTPRVTGDLDPGRQMFRLIHDKRGDGR